MTAYPFKERNDHLKWTFAHFAVEMLVKECEKIRMSARRVAGGDMIRTYPASFMSFPSETASLDDPSTPRMRRRNGAHGCRSETELVGMNPIGANITAAQIDYQACPGCIWIVLSKEKQLLACDVRSLKLRAFDSRTWHKAA